MRSALLAIALAALAAPAFAQQPADSVPNRGLSLRHTGPALVMQGEEFRPYRAGPGGIVTGNALGAHILATRPNSIEARNGAIVSPRYQVESSAGFTPSYGPSSFVAPQPDSNPFPVQPEIN